MQAHHEFLAVVTAGGIHGCVEVERILRDGEADIIAAARQSIADPDWYRKMRLGLGDRVRVRIYSNYCKVLDTRHQQVTCKLWDRENKDEMGVALSSDGRRRMRPPAYEVAKDLST